MRKIRLTTLIIILVSFSQLYAEPLFGLASIFNDGVILQCDKPVNIFGIAKPNSEVIVKLNSKIVGSSITNKSGQWLVKIPQHSASEKTYFLEVLSENQKDSCKEVRFGEVWLATGQSNMFQPAKVTPEGSEAIKHIHPNIHFAQVPKRTGGVYTPKLQKEEIPWGNFGPDHNQLAAVAFHFAEELQPKVNKHIGMIQCSYGGTPIESWMPKELLMSLDSGRWVKQAFESAEKLKRQPDEWKAEMALYEKKKSALKKWRKNKSGPQPEVIFPHQGNPFHSRTASTLYESMTKEIIPFTIRGVLWYQGEGNASRPKEYIELLSAHIHQARKDFQDDSLPFYIVQLSAYGPGKKHWPDFRIAQSKVRDNTPYTGLALSLDKGDKTDIHPKDKKPVGQRLAYLALHNVYGKNTPSRGPKIKSASQKNDKVILEFDFVENGLQKIGSQSFLTGFEAADQSMTFNKVKGKIVANNKIELDTSELKKPKVVRYAYDGYFEPELNLINSAHLPTEPFVINIQSF